MKRLLITAFCSVALALGVLGQDPTASPATSATPATMATPVFTGATSSAPPASATATPIASASPDEDESEDELERAIEKKVRKHFRMTIDGHNKGFDHDFDGSEFLAIPIVGIIFTTLFGAPVMVVAVIMFMNYLKARSLHRTVRTMVEKGQEVPAALFAPPPVQRRRSDLRRGIVWSMIGAGFVVFLGAVNDWEGGAWSFGIIPLLIGVGYLLVWKLEGPKDNGAPVA